MMLGKIEPPEGALPFLEPSGQAGNERAVREVRAGGRRHGAADAANPHPRHETLPQGGGGTGRTVFRSTLLAPDRRMLAGSGIPELTREIAIILKLEGYEEAAE